MYPIYEVGGGRSIGYRIDDFIRRFDLILDEHISEKRAKAFAFICWDYDSYKLKEILLDEGVFATLDRLTGDRLSVFYLNGGQVPETIWRFNSFLLAQLGAEDVQPPCVIFCRLNRGVIDDVSAVQLNSQDEIHAFQELYTVIGGWLEAASQEPKYWKWVKIGASFITVEAIKAALRHFMGMSEHPH